jgi:hypothetical protein
MLIREEYSLGLIHCSSKQQIIYCRVHTFSHVVKNPVTKLTAQTNPVCMTNSLLIFQMEENRQL